MMQEAGHRWNTLNGGWDLSTQLHHWATECVVCNESGIPRFAWLSYEGTVQLWWTKRESEDVSSGPGGQVSKFLLQGLFKEFFPSLLQTEVVVVEGKPALLPHHLHTRCYSTWQTAHLYSLRSSGANYLQTENYFSFAAVFVIGPFCQLSENVLPLS